MKEEILKIVKDIEDKDIRYINKQWYYHGSKFDYDKYKSILTKGILCNYLLFKNTRECNGKYYISVCKDKVCDFEYSSYLQFLESMPMFILNENTDVIPTRAENLIGILLRNTKSTYRISEYDDEYQVPFKIDTKNILGIEFYLEKIIKNKKDEEKIKKVILELNEMIKLMNEIGVDLPIYDYSTYKEINKDKVLKLEI